MPLISNLTRAPFPYCLSFYCFLPLYHQERIYAEFVNAVPVAQAKAAAAARAVKTASKTAASSSSSGGGGASVLPPSAAAGTNETAATAMAMVPSVPSSSLPAPKVTTLAAGGAGASDKALKSAMKQAETLAAQCATAKAAVEDSLSWRIAPKLSALLGDAHGGYPLNNNGGGGGAGSGGLSALVVRDAASCKEALLTVCESKMQFSVQFFNERCLSFEPPPFVISLRVLLLPSYCQTTNCSCVYKRCATSCWKRRTAPRPGCRKPAGAGTAPPPTACCCGRTRGRSRSPRSTK